MFFGEIKQLFFTFSNSVNLFISTNFNDGLMIPEEKLNLILFGLAFLFFVICYGFWSWLRRETPKDKAYRNVVLNEKNRTIESIEEGDKGIDEQSSMDKKFLIRQKGKDEFVEFEKNKEVPLKELISVEKENANQEINDIDVLEDSRINERSEMSIPFIDRLRKGIGKTRKQIQKNISNVVLGKKQIDEDLLDDLEEILISSDIGPETTLLIIESITQKVERKELTNPQVLQSEIQKEIIKIMDKKYPSQITSEVKPQILLVVGVNGVGKTTTIGKIASQFREQGKKVLMGAADTFRAAAIEQLEEWSIRADCEILSKDHGSDPSAVIHETVQKGLNEKFDVVICDTAGRLHTKKNLMEELKKMVRVIQNLIPDAPHEVLLVLDASTGQNAILQTREFKEATNLTGLIITKLDGTSKGGVVIGIVNEFDIPVRYIGVGEQIEDLRPFNSKEFTESIFT